MIKIENLGKIYSPKKGVPVVALDRVNLTLGDTGMVFLLGKSGSGKSTLLNLLGGLDKPSSGSFTIEGKSSEKFNQNNYDAYRNTYLGFIFQEYNILEEFTVGVNIGLALELQGKKAKSESINEILKQVDLEGYGNRKPNELSGGQKQRIAIARALIKDPQIIMADEPTGALDSNTGKAVFETLLSLSKEKLVIVVSHDRENAEIYADRIIELADGKVISDETKHKLSTDEQDAERKKFVGGYVLNDKDAQLIQDYISGAKTPQNRNFNFIETKEQDIVIKENSKPKKMIPSRLPMRKAFKMGASPLKAKPVRLAFTILLCLVAFTLFGLMDTVSTFNYVDAYNSAIEIGGYETASMQKQVNVGSTDSYYTSQNMTESELTELQKTVGQESVPLLSYNTYINSINITNGFYTNQINNVATSSADQLKSLGFAVSGTVPTEYNEIMLSNYIYTAMKLYGITAYEAIPSTDPDYNEDEPNRNYKEVTYSSSDITDITTLLSKNIYICYDEEYLLITGFFDTGLQDDTAYAELKKDTPEYNNAYFTASTKLSEEQKSGFSCVMVVSQSRFDAIKVIMEENSSNMSGDINITVDGNTYNNWISQLKIYDSSDDNIIYYNGSKLNDDEILLGQEFLMNLLWEKEFTISSYMNWEGLILGDGFEPQETTSTFSYQQYMEYSYGWSNSIDLDLATAYVKNSNFTEQEMDDLFEYYYSDSFWNDYGNTTEEKKVATFKEVLINYGIESDSFVASMLTDAQEELALSYLISFHGVVDTSDIAEILFTAMSVDFDDIFASMSGSAMLYSETDGEINKDFKIVGVTSYSSSTIVANENFFPLESTDPLIYSSLFIVLPTNVDALKELITLGVESGEDTIYKMLTPVSSSVETASSFISQLTNVFLYVGIGFAVFAMLMMYNFMSTSIAYKRNEIGILRAIGSRSGDVFKIFFAESFIVSIINFVLASIATVAIAIVINTALVAEMGMVISLLIVSVRQIALILGISFLTAFIASFIPVKKIASKRPIDAIRGK